MTTANLDVTVVNPPAFLHRLFFGLAILTLFLMAIGSATRVMNAGLACPDWPLCYGELIPSRYMNLQVFLEWFHRLVASSIGVLMIGLTGATWWLRRRLPTWVPLGTTLCLVLVIVQGVLGGLTVTQLLRFDIVTAHLATGLLFFSSLLVIGTTLMPYKATGGNNSLHWFGLVAVSCVYFQSILGGLVASRWAVRQCLGGFQLCQVMHNHLWGVLPASLSVLLLVGFAWRTPALQIGMRRLMLVAMGLLGAQVLIGFVTLRLRLQVPWLTVSHQAVGAMLLGTLVVFSVLALRDRQQTQSISSIQSVATATTSNPDVPS